MARLDEVKSWMRWWGWDETRRVKLDGKGEPVAKWGDPTFEADIERAIAIEASLSAKSETK